MIRDIDLLTGDFLSVLPNPQDRIASRYDGIRQSVVEAMNDKALTPSYPKGHSPARHLLQAKASLKNLLSTADLEFLVDYDDSPPRWAIAATQKNSDVDRFLDGLAIREWDTEEFIGVFEENATDNAYSDPEDDFMQWLASKTDEWHQRLYAYWYRELEPEGDLGRLEELCIVRLTNGQHSVAGSSFFPTDEVDDDDALPRVSKAVYTSGKSKTEQESARKLLAEIGVREVGEAEQIEALLRQRYRNEEFDPQIADIKRFVALVEKQPDAAELFEDYWIFLREDGQWGQPGQVYLDAPYLDTELRAYFNAFGKNADRAALSKDYRDAGVSSKRLGEFARRVGVSCQLEIKEVSCRSNPEVHNLVWRAPGSETSYKIDRDYQIQGLDKILDGSSEPLSRLVWRTCANLKYPDWTKAQYRSNRNHHPPNEAPSQLGFLERPPSAQMSQILQGSSFA